MEFVLSAPGNVAATIPVTTYYITAMQFLKVVYAHICMCLPVLKREEHRQALLKAIKSGSKKFFLGTDSAAHLQSAKEASCGCAGVFSAVAALELYVEAFEEADALDNLEAFTSFNGPDFYGLPRNTTKIHLVKEDWVMPEHIVVQGNNLLIPLRAGEVIKWKVSK